MKGINYIRKAIDFAIIKHDGQCRVATGLPYVTHPLKVGVMLQSMNMSYAVIIAGILHDTLEDTKTTYEELVIEFGKEVADIVVELTSNNREIRKVGKNRYLIEKMINMSKSAFLVKLADRLDNIMDRPKDKYIEDTLQMVKELRERRETISIEAEDILDRIEEVARSKKSYKMSRLS